MLATVCRRVETVRLRQQIAPALMRVIDDIQTGRPQPGSVEIPIDLQYADREVTPAEHAAVPVPEPVQPEQAAVEAAAELLAGAVRPLIIAGGGVVRSGGAQCPAGAAAELRALAEVLGAPVLVSANGRGALPDDHPLCLGNLVYHPEVRALREEADVVLAVGTRLQVGSEARNYAALGGKLIHLDADAGVIHRVSPAELAVVADASRRPGRRYRRSGRPRRPHRPRRGRCTAGVGGARRGSARHRAGAAARPGRPDHFAIMEELRAATPRDTRLVRDSTVPAYLWANQMLPILEPRTSMHPTAGAIGPGLPLAIGAAVATGSRTVLIAGDGGFMLHVGELAVAAQYRLPVTICLFNDRGYGVLRRIEDARFAGAQVRRRPGYARLPALAGSMGVEAHAVAGVEEFRTAFRAAADADGPVLLDIDLNALHPIGEYPPRPR